MIKSKKLLVAAAAVIAIAPGLALAASTATSNLDVSLTITDYCTADATTAVSFGSNQGILTAAVDATGTVRFTCNNIPYSISLDNGLYASSTQRRLKSGTNYVNYDLFTDSNHANSWRSASVSDTGTSAQQSFPVYGRVPAQSTPAAGTYTDTVVATITY